MTVCPVFSQESGTTHQSEPVPRYKGFGFGLFGLGEYILGEYSEFALCDAGGLFTAEYTMPGTIFSSCDWGLAADLGFAHVFQKADTTLARCEDLIFDLGVFFRVPFKLGSAWFALQPALRYGGDVHLSEGSSFADINSLYVDQRLTANLGLRFIPHNHPALEIEFSPQYVCMPEKNWVIHQVGARLGFVYHFSGAYGTNVVYIEPEFDIEAALRDTKKILGVGPREINNFTPDGDQINDTVTFTPNFYFLTKAPKSWKMVVDDPASNRFYTAGGEGAFPEKIVWDGVGDGGETVFGRNTYMANFTIIPSDEDVEKYGLKVMETFVVLRTGTIVEVLSEHEKRITIQSLSFDPDAATFNELTVDQIAERDATMDSIVAVVKATPNAKVKVMAYANNVSNTERENQKELIPLSEKRAQVLVQMLIDRGLKPEDVEGIGMGGANPIADWKDKANWWKNRRFEFMISW